MIDLQNENVINLHQAAKGIVSYRPGHPSHVSTLVRWILRGVKGPGDVRVHLRAARIGGRWVTSREALQEFVAAQTPAVGADPAARLPRTPTRRDRAAAQALEELGRLGI